MSKQLRLPTLLVIAENPSVRFWIKKHLDERFFIIQATTKAEAIAAFNARLDFIIVDAALEECEPFELCKEISKFTNGLVPILLITGRLKKSFRDQATQAGVTDFLSDQLDLEELELRIATAKKADLSRQKTIDLASKIKMPKGPVSTDSVKNKFLFNEAARHLFKAVQEQKSSLYLLLFRLDGLNAQWKERLHSQLRKTDLLINLVDGNGILLLSHTNRDEAKKIGETLQKQATSLHLTLAIVISPLKPEESEFYRIFEAASNKLKQMSKNQLDFLE